MNHNPDILDRLHHAQPPRPYIRLIDDSIIEIEWLRAQLTQQGNPVRHNPDIQEVFIATTDIELVRTAGNQLERQLMRLHRHHHGPECSTCEALLTWWTVNGR
jgi:hypothetical protein